MHTIEPHTRYSNHYKAKLYETAEKYRWFCNVPAGGCEVQVLKLYLRNVENISTNYYNKIKLKYTKNESRRCRLRDVEAGGILGSVTPEW
jgi:hypothetical protein